MKHKSVLIVEDHQEIREVMQQLLELHGYRVSTASNGKEALVSLGTQHQPGLVLLDLMMPVMTGWEFLDELRSREAFRSLPVVVISAYQDRTPSNDVQGVLKKPVDFDALVSKVEEYCTPS